MIALMKVVLASLLLALVFCDSPADVPDDNKKPVECSRVMCRMYCEYGFKRDENGCEYCACNRSPQPCPTLDCVRTCRNGYRKDYSGCTTCQCECPKLECLGTTTCKNGFKKDEDECLTCTCEDESETIDDKCPNVACNLECKYGLEKDENGCQLCSCNRCPLSQCRMFCMYGFRKNEDGCDVCECNWEPIGEKMPCDERTECPGTRICNLNIRLCESVDPDNVNWFLYDFEIENEEYLFEDAEFLRSFKTGLIHNIAAKYGLENTQIRVSSVENNGLTSFQIMPFSTDNLDVFQNKMDQIDIDLNSHEFRQLLPSITEVIDDKHIPREHVPTWCARFKHLLRAKAMVFTLIVLSVVVTFILLIGCINLRRHQSKLSIRSDSKVPIYEPAYQPLTSVDDDYHYPASSSDVSQYFVVEADEKPLSNTKPAKV